MFKGKLTFDTITSFPLLHDPYKYKLLCSRKHFPGIRSRTDN